ncbi:MAG TPA: hypothetical protein VFC19_07095 [Candidatus Limnocylindrales bacterium]|nr:hypothetical protein [Candidatus Limnocylindrales bacterium]
MKPEEVEAQEQDSERFWKTPNTLDAEGLRAAAGEARPEDVEPESLSAGEDTPDSAPAAI